MGKRRPNKGGRVVVPQVGDEGFQVVFAGPPVNLAPFPEKYTVVTLTPADDCPRVSAGPGVPWDERTAWRRHKPVGVPVIDPDGSEPLRAVPPVSRPTTSPAANELVVEIEVPDEATDADVWRYVELFVHKADQFYRINGGNGLKVSGLDATGEPVPKSDPVVGGVG